MCRLIWVEMTSGARLRRLRGFTLRTRVCSARCLALRLRRIGDELESVWAGKKHANVWRYGVHMICAAIHVMGLILLLTRKRHL